MTTLAIRKRICYHEGVFKEVACPAEETRKLARGRVPDGREISPGGPELLLKEEFLMKKSLVLAMAMALGVSATAFAANPFSDVPAGH